jgi:hypothetical protein
MKDKKKEKEERALTFEEAMRKIITVPKGRRLRKRLKKKRKSPEENYVEKG